VSQTDGDKRCSGVSATNDAAVGIEVDGIKEAVISPGDGPFDLEAVFEAQYANITRAIAAVIHNPGRAEELAVEVFLKWSRTPAAQGPDARGWLYRASIRVALDELRRQVRRNRHEPLLALVGKAPTPHEILSAKEDQGRVRMVLSAMRPRQAEMLLLRSQGFDYNQLAATLDLNPASVGTLLGRAQQAFRKEYVKRYGEQ
jgi:RNA polymerase sigma-70 factor (ECF subfamily)